MENGIWEKWDSGKVGFWESGILGKWDFEKVILSLKESIYKAAFLPSGV